MCAVGAVRQRDEADGRDGRGRTVDDFLDFDLGRVLVDGNIGRAEADGVALARHARGRREFASLKLPGDKDRPPKNLERSCHQQESGRQQHSRTT